MMRFRRYWFDGGSHISTAQTVTGMYVLGPKAAKYDRPVGMQPLTVTLQRIKMPENMVGVLGAVLALRLASIR